MGRRPLAPCVPDSKGGHCLTRPASCPEPLLTWQLSVPWALSAADWHPRPLHFVWTVKPSRPETEAEDWFFTSEKCQLVATATGIVNPRCHISLELLRALRTKEKAEEQREIQCLKQPENKKEDRGGKWRPAVLTSRVSLRPGGARPAETESAHYWHACAALQAEDLMGSASPAVPVCVCDSSACEGRVPTRENGSGCAADPELGPPGLASVSLSVKSKKQTKN